MTVSLYFGLINIMNYVFFIYSDIGFKQVNMRIFIVFNLLLQMVYATVNVTEYLNDNGYIKSSEIVITDLTFRSRVESVISEYLSLLIEKKMEKISVELV